MNSEERRRLKTTLSEVQKKREEAEHPAMGQYYKGQEDVLKKIIEEFV